MATAGGRYAAKAKPQDVRKAKAKADATRNAGGTPVGTTEGTAQQRSMEDRLEQQRAAGDDMREQAEQRLADTQATRGTGTGGVFTAVSKNGLAHRRNGIMFGAEPVSVDTGNWSPVELERFFTDSVLMIVPGQQLGAKGGILVPERTLIAGSTGENATPEMLVAAARGIPMAHPSTGGGSRPAGGAPNPVVSALEKTLNNSSDNEA